MYVAKKVIILINLYPEQVGLLVLVACSTQLRGPMMDADQGGQTSESQRSKVRRSKYLCQ